MDTNEKNITSKTVKFSLSFTPEAEKYIQIYKKQGKKPSIQGFARRIGVDEKTVWAWANKKAKDEKGNLLDKLARPNFHAVIKQIEELENQPQEKRLNVNQELFCKLYASDQEFFGNGVQSYIAAYGIDLTKKGAYHAARSSAYELLTKPDILYRINELMELGQLNNVFVDKQLQFVIAQNADLSSKVAAIREYNKLESRITEKIDHTTKGKELPRPILGGISHVQQNDSNK